ncbi:MAG: hypothetical protein JST00_14170 [Deltaproteobacteria bacterium]|nr:hypothetical protein [Deltaproteobacteria bacterium]
MGRPKKPAARTEVRPSRTRPSGQDTGYSHERCYAKDLADCDMQISREHYISASVLADLGEVFHVTRERLGWEAKKLTANALACNMLCRRHNSALSCLDVAGRDFVRCLRLSQERAAAGGGRDVFNGIDLERWLLKMLCGYTVLDGDPVPLAWQRLLFGYEEIRRPSGLHMNVAVGQTIGGGEHAIELATAYDTEGRRVGCSVTLHGYRFLLGLDGRSIGGLEDFGKETLMRPREVKWRAPTGSYRLFFEWPWSDRPSPDRS